MAIYLITDNSSSEPKKHLVEAKTKGQALSAVVEPRFSVQPATNTDLIECTKKGIEVVKA